MGDGKEKRPETKSPEVDPLAQGGVWRVPPPKKTFGSEETTSGEEPLRAADPIESIELGEPVEPAPPAEQAEIDHPIESSVESAEKVETLRGSDAGEFTQLFAAADPIIPEEPEPERIPTQTMMPAVAQPPVEPPSEPAAEPEPEPESFTRMFEAANTALPTETNIPVAGSQTEKPESGEFTRLFRSQPPGEKPVAGPAPESFGSPFAEPHTPGQPPSSGAPPTRSSSEPGDFTRFFQPSMGAGSLAESDLSKSAPPPKQPEQPKREPSEYTRLFKAPPPEKPQQGDSGATLAFSTPVTPSAPEPTDAPPVAEGPSEFTMVIRTPDAEGSGGESPAAQSDAAPEKVDPAAEPPKSGKFAKVMIIVLSVLVVALIGLVLYLALKE